MYGLDWDHIALDKLDEIAKRDSFSKYLEDGHKLERTTEEPKIFASGGPSVTKFTTTFGKIEQPRFITADCTVYIFMFAKFRDGHFFLKTRIEKKETEPVEGEYTISQLRDMIGELPRSKTSFFGKLVSLFR